MTKHSQEDRDTLNGLLEEEADDLVGAERYERTADHEAYRAGRYERELATTSGEVAIRMPKLKGIRFTTAVIERYRCRRPRRPAPSYRRRTCGPPIRTPAGVQLFVHIPNLSNKSQ